MSQRKRRYDSSDNFRVESKENRRHYEDRIRKRSSTKDYDQYSYRHKSSRDMRFSPEYYPDTVTKDAKKYREKDARVKLREIKKHAVDAPVPKTKIDMGQAHVPSVKLVTKKLKPKDAEKNEEKNVHVESKEIKKNTVDVPVPKTKIDMDQGYVPPDKLVTKKFTPKDAEKHKERDVHVESEEIKKHAVDAPVPKTESDTIYLKMGEVYIPPAKLVMMQNEIFNKKSAEYQKLTWLTLKKNIICLTNKINEFNIKYVVRELFKENIIRGKGVLAKQIIQVQTMSPIFTELYAALVSIINSKFPEIGELILKRIIIQFKKAFKRKDKNTSIASSRLIAHLFNQQVAHKVVVLGMLTLFLENPTEHSIEMAVIMLIDCGERLTAVLAREINAIFDCLRRIVNGISVTLRVHRMIEALFCIQKENFKNNKAVKAKFNLVKGYEKYTHFLTLEDPDDPQDLLNVFQFDPEYEIKEQQYKEITKEFLGEAGIGDFCSDHDDKVEQEEEKCKENQQIMDMAETNLMALRRIISLMKKSKFDYEECARKILQLKLNPPRIKEMCYMILDCCTQQQVYEKYYGLLAMHLCLLNEVYVESFVDIFKNSYEMIHGLETTRLRNIAKFFSCLLLTDSIPWMVFSIIKLNEESTFSQRIFIKILFKQLSDYMGIEKLNIRIKDVTLQKAFDGIFPRDNPQHTRFAINFFTPIGLGCLTDHLKLHSSNAAKIEPVKDCIISTAENLPTHSASSQSDSSSSSTSSSSSSSSSSLSSSSSSSSESEEKVASKRRKVSSRQKRKEKVEYAKLKYVQETSYRRKHKKH